MRIDSNVMTVRLDGYCRLATSCEAVFFLSDEPL